MPGSQPPVRDASSSGQVLLIFFLGGVYIVVSAGMIAFNKYLVNEERFPFAIFLVLCQTGFCSLMAFLLLLIKPSLFPSLTCPENKVPIDSSLVFYGTLPIAVFFSGQLVLSNTAYLHSSVAFLQMIKESNLVLVYLFSLIATLEVFSWVKARVLVCIVFATMLTIKGELRFSMLGFIIQGTSQLFESSKIVLQALILSNNGRKLDPLSYVALVMPLCFLVLGGLLSILMVARPVDTLRTPAMADIIVWWPALLGNACVAFALNVIIAVFMKNSSAVAFILAGITKDAVIVLAGSLFLGELVSGLQIFAFSCQLILILTWSIMKLFPARFEEGVSAGFWSLYEGEKDNRLPISCQSGEQGGYKSMGSTQTTA